MKIDWLGKPYYSLNAYLRYVFGQKCYKISVDAGLSCPNRDGTKGTKGCIFCSSGGSGDFAVSGQFFCVEDQIKTGISRFNKKVGEKFIIYFQAFTNTYGDTDYLRQIWTVALDTENVVGISIATRPDCLGDEIMNLLSDISAYAVSMQKCVWVEMGLQTIHPETAVYIRREYELEEYDRALEKLSEAGVSVITHVILGLPGETDQMMLDTVSYVNEHYLGIMEKYPGYREHKKTGKNPVHLGIKLQLLHVLKGTDLAEDYAKGCFHVLSREHYFDLLEACLSILDENIVIHRLTGDGPKKLLIEPKWSADKKGVLNALTGRLNKSDATVR